MKVQLVKTKEIREVNDSYGSRMIEQGKAIPYTPKAQFTQKRIEMDDAEKVTHEERVNEKLTAKKR